MYYNPQLKKTTKLVNLRKLLNTSIPYGTEKVAGWYLLHEAERPAYTSKQRLVAGAIIAHEGKYIRTWKVENRPQEELELQEALDASEALEEQRLPELEDAIVDVAEYVASLEEQRIPEMEDALVEVADYVSSLDEKRFPEVENALVELADWIASIEERIENK